MDLQRKVGHSTDNGKQCQARAESGSQLLQGDALGKSSSEAKICSATESGSLDPLVLGEHPEPTTGLSESKDQQIKVELRCLNDESLTLVGLKSDFNKNLFFRVALCCSDAKKGIPVQFESRFVAGTFIACPMKHGINVLNEPKNTSFSFDVAEYFDLLSFDEFDEYSVHEALEAHVGIKEKEKLQWISKSMSVTGIFRLCFTIGYFKTYVDKVSKQIEETPKRSKIFVEKIGFVFIRILRRCESMVHADMVMNGLLRLLSTFSSEHIDFGFLLDEEHQDHFVRLEEFVQNQQHEDLIFRKKLGLIFVTMFLEKYRCVTWRWKRDKSPRNYQNETRYPEGWF